MANTATLTDIIHCGIGGGGPLKVYSINITGTGTDLTVATPDDPTKRLFVVQQFLAEGGTPTIQYISQSPTLTGTINHTTGSTALSGTATVFTKDFLSGGTPFQVVITSGNTLTVASTSSATQMTASASATTTVTGKTYKRRLTLAAPELAANQAIYDKVSNGFILATWPGDSLIVQSSAAIGANNWSLYVMEAYDDLSFR